MGLAITAVSCATLRPLARQLGFNIGLSDDVSIPSSNNQNPDIRRRFQLPNRRPGDLGIPGLSILMASRTTGGNGRSRNDSITSETTTHCATRFDSAKWPDGSDADEEQGTASSEPSSLGSPSIEQSAPT